MVDYRTEEEQVEQLKRWWKQNGPFTVVMTVMMLIAFFGWQYYKNDQLETQEAATQAFGEFFSHWSKNKKEQAIQVGDKLLQDHGDTFQAMQTSLMMAKYYVEKGELDKSVPLLKTVKENGQIKFFQALAGLRLARVYYQLGKYDEGLHVLKLENAGRLAGLVEELRGDLYLAKGDTESAKFAYRAAIEKEPMSGRSQIVQMKLDDLTTNKKAQAKSG